jgi:[ribosomal protein S5]-alanine N-acetyltransferase
MNFRQSIPADPMNPSLRTERLVLRPLDPGDAPAIFAIMSDDETMRFWDWPAVRNLETVAEIVADQIADMADGRAVYWAAALGPRVIGSCDLSEIDRHHGRAELGFLFNRVYWGNDYALEAMAAVVGHAFGQIGLERLWARFHTGNEASRRLLERLGFAYEGTLKRHVARGGERRDCILYGRSREA